MREFKVTDSFDHSVAFDPIKIKRVEFVPMSQAHTFIIGPYSSPLTIKKLAGITCLSNESVSWCPILLKHLRNKVQIIFKEPIFLHYAYILLCTEMSKSFERIIELSKLTFLLDKFWGPDDESDLLRTQICEGGALAIFPVEGERIQRFIIVMKMS